MSDVFVIDNSVVMAWCFEDEASKYADSILDSLKSSEAIVPSVWPLEVGNVLLVAERRKRITEADIVRALTLISELSITVEQESPSRMMKEIIALAREHKLSTYDASYLDLAMTRGVSIATQDKSLRRAARKCKVPIFSH